MIEFCGIAVPFAETDPGTPPVTNEWTARIDLAAAAHGFPITVRVVRFRNGGLHGVYPVYEMVIDDIRSYLNEQMAVLHRHCQAVPNGRAQNMIDQIAGKLTRNRQEAMLAIIQNRMFWGIAMGWTPEHLINTHQMISLQRQSLLRTLPRQVPSVRQWL